MKILTTMRDIEVKTVRPERVLTVELEGEDEIKVFHDIMNSLTAMGVAVQAAGARSTARDVLDLALKIHNGMADIDTRYCK